MALYAFDGTWDEWDPETETLATESRRERPFSNVVLACMHYPGQYSYVNGPGTRGWKFSHAFGGAMGIGASRRMIEQFKALRQKFAAGDDVIDIIGYSRGAAIARMFVDRIYADYDDIRDATGQQLTAPPTVRFLGLFDTVASFGFAWTDEEWHFQPWIPGNVKQVRHAMSMDERRETFELDRIAEPYAFEQEVKEVWFRGGHSDIGGNAVVGKNPWVANRERGSISLTWMMEEARDCGVRFSDEAIDKFRALVDVDAPITAARDPVDFAFLGFERGDHALEIEGDDLFHRSVRECSLKKTVHKVKLAALPADVPDENFV